MTDVNPVDRFVLIRKAIAGDVTLEKVPYIPFVVVLGGNIKIHKAKKPSPTPANVEAHLSVYRIILEESTDLRTEEAEGSPDNVSHISQPYP